MASVKSKTVLALSLGEEVVGVYDNTGFRAAWNLRLLRVGEHDGALLRVLGEKLNAQLAKKKYDMVAFELPGYGPRFEETLKAKHSEQIGICLSVCAVRNVRVSRVDPKLVCKYATGAVTSTPELMLEKATLAGEASGGSIHIARAYWVYSFALQQSGVGLVD